LLSVRYAQPRMPAVNPMAARSKRRPAADEPPGSLKNGRNSLCLLLLLYDNAEIMLTTGWRNTNPQPGGFRNATFVVARDDGLTDEPRDRIFPSLLVICKCKVGAVAEFL